MKSNEGVTRTGIVILAAGRGARMNHAIPKVLVLVGGVPMILRALSAAEAANFKTKPVVVVGYKKELVKKIVGARARYAWQCRQLGTGHAVAATKSLLYKKVGQVIVIYGDHPFTSANLLRRLASLQERTRAVVAMTTVVVPNFLGPRRIFLRYGHIVRDPRGRFVKRCVEYKDATARERAIREVNSGHYCFEAKWLWQSLPKLKRKNFKNEYYLTDLIGLAVAEGRRVAPLALKNWHEGLGVNTMEEVKIAEGVATKNLKSKSYEL
ncbi:hypothetical protein A3H10_02930 [Candidatus Uhrbacteria bacterium RIFCSPLOWO2_12_FULL_46_10]|uniref:MobA-like NTP transferase domain-containing protein n=1 Tax=Candidatus Uhrbacteria bacterium RIFCSPLOWO2_01_FULL_47_25 TaxID=1802402 RepID=A0A1F7UW77_9BACT|nr:MAG: hypothetical protein A2752_04935 [Candidatus Uhrbacteria bacterium RIFCSPHIGHO2_01_FULL_46_23]OGL68051.1 MAG: hypothetical protein A3D60_02870 [Candidatus Uhrbacteria bacterium RIFCSPHIGHO2_02_FULL_47_29]OGL76227.1 MAG: hypothetical protein A3E96_03910 [Candidatus Uhrbacteria bacterium RIFCSPHIGHO2_12_FULL_46_13]OGL82506.1 MAG: hypothetical protein A2936_03740 [Candidatus Uhrbacteria bacterium RIFCSPLOWO2_01_FULL_47_25]OGL85951.1 MAG: hypothetical protein A3I37_00245 [Candidatus Uhrbact